MALPRRCLSAGSDLAGFGGRLHLDQPAALDIIDIAVDRHVGGHQRMRPDALHVGYDALGLVLDGQPIDEVAFRGAGSLPDIAPAPGPDLRGVEALLQQPAHHLIGEGLHAAIGVMDHEPFVRPEQLVRDDQRADGVVACASAGVADDMRVPFPQAGVFGGIEPRIHAGEDGEAARRGHRQAGLVAEVFRVGLVRREHLVMHLGHRILLDSGLAAYWRA